MIKGLEKYFDAAFTAPDGIKRLRELILTLAMQGKLTNQSDKDEPANKLLKKIAQEMKRLEKEGTIKKQKLLPPITEGEVPYNLPEGWEWCRMGTLGTIRGGKRLPQGMSFATSPTKYIYLRVTDMKNGTIIDSDLKYIDENVYKLISQYTISSSDIYITIAGTIGNCGIVPARFDNMNLTENAAKLSLSVVDKLYILTVIKSEVVKKQFCEKTNQMAQPKLALERIATTLIPLPPLAEQERIVERINELMACCDELEVMQKEQENKRRSARSAAMYALTTSKQDTDSAISFTNNWNFLVTHFESMFTTKEDVAELRKTILQLAVMGKLTKQSDKDEPASKLLKKIAQEKKNLEKEGKIKNKKPLLPITEDEKPYPLPKGWEWVRLDDICELITDGTHYTPRYVSEGVPFLSVKNLSSGVINFESVKFITEKEHIELTKRCKPEKNDILLTKIGTTGIAVQINTDEAFSIFVSVALLKLIKKFTFSAYFVYLINSPLVKKYSADGTEGVGNKNLVLRKIKNFVIPTPPLAEQERIVQRVNELMGLCDILEKNITDCTQKQSSLLNAVVASA